MKKILLVVALVAGGLVVNAQNDICKNTHTQQPKESSYDYYDDDYGENHISSKNAPLKAKETLNSKYPEASKVEWMYERYKYEAEFSIDKSKYKVLFDNSGNWISTRVHKMAMNEVPQNVKDGIQRSEFNSWKIKGVDSEERNEKTIYKVEVKSGMKEKELIVDENGNIVKCSM